MRWSTARGATAAGVLPAAFLVALLVGAPFAGTTTAPLIADRAASAQAAGQTAGQPASYDGTSTGADTTATATTTRTGSDAPSMPGARIGVPRASMLTLVVSWLTLAFVGFAVLIAAARGASRRVAHASASAPDSPSSW